MSEELKRCGICALAITEHEHWTTDACGIVHFSCHLSNKLTKSIKEIGTLRTQLKSLEADAETSSGKSLLERLKEAEYLLRHAGDPTWSLNYEQSKDWLKRRDAFLNPTEQG